jgi:hypothetical protein
MTQDKNDYLRTYYLGYIISFVDGHIIIIFVMLWTTMYLPSVIKNVFESQLFLLIILESWPLPTMSPEWRITYEANTYSII